MVKDAGCKVINISGIVNEQEIEKVYRLRLNTRNVNLLYQSDILNLILTEIKLRSMILEEINLYAVCIMPFHISIVLSVKEENTDLKSWVKKFKTYITRNSDVKKLWKPLFEFEKIDNPMLTYKCEEVVKQPEAMGLVDNWCDYGLSFMV